MERQMNIKEEIQCRKAKMTKANYLKSYKN